MPPPTHLNTFEEERREVMETVFQSICHHPADPDEMEACVYLVRHLSGCGGAAGAGPPHEQLAPGFRLRPVYQRLHIGEAVGCLRVIAARQTSGV